MAPSQPFSGHVQIEGQIFRVPLDWLDRDIPQIGPVSLLVVLHLLIRDPVRGLLQGTPDELRSKEKLPDFLVIWVTPVDAERCLKVALSSSKPAFEFLLVLEVACQNMLRRSKPGQGDSLVHLTL